MSLTKKIQIKKEYLSSQEGGRKRRKEKPKNYITPNKVKRALINRIKEHRKKQEENNKPPPVFATDFKKTLTYLDSVVSKKKTIKQKKKKRRRRKKKGGDGVVVGGELPIHCKISNRDDPPYGILKGGKKPLYSQYKKTLKKSSSVAFPSQVTSPPPPSPLLTTSLSLTDGRGCRKRQEKLERLKRKLKTPTRKIRKKRYTLGKRKGKVGILIKSRKTRRKIKREHHKLKKKPLSGIKLYLKKHGLIKVGGCAPENVLREIYETAILSGDVYNKNNAVLMHNYINDKKES